KCAIRGTREGGGLDHIADSVELPCATDFAGDVRCTGDYPMMSMSREVLHPSVRRQGLHVELQDRARIWWRHERGDLLGRQSAIVHQDLIHNSFNRSAAGASYT